MTSKVLIVERLIEQRFGKKRKSFFGRDFSTLRLMMRYLSVLLFLILSGCAPWPTTTQPEVNLFVVDEVGNPISGARVFFASYKIAITPESTIVTGKTNNQGMFHLERTAYTQMVIFAADGGHFFDWSYCIEKPGLQAIARNSLSESYFSEGSIVEKMNISSETQECKWQEFPHGFLPSKSGF